jgi:hypothetical protein
MEQTYFLSERQRLAARTEMLRQQRNTWLTHWQELADNFLPRRFRFNTNDAKWRAGTKRNEKIINNTPTKSARTLASGMMAGITSPARTWFRLVTNSPELMEKKAVKVYLHEVEEEIRLVFAKSNFYNALADGVYPDLGVFGTNCTFIEEDDEDVIRCYTLPLGEYCLASSHRGVIDTVARDVAFTVAMVVDRFGLENCSEYLKQMVRENRLDTWVDVVHVVEPNQSWNPYKSGPAGMRWSSKWYEKNTSAVSGDPEFLKRGGYEEFPAVCPRWNVTGMDIYGSSPGMDALGDAKALQWLEARGAEVMDKVVRPPMVGPASLRNQRASLLPGDVTYLDGPNAKFEPAIIVNSQAVSVNEEKIRQHENRIQGTFYADLWAMMLNDTRTQPVTAREVEERHEEKMLMLGPVLERLNDELLDPAITRVFNILQRKGRLPEPPPELQGTDVKVEYVSVMASAQRMVGISGVERTVAFVTNLAQLRPDSTDKLDIDKIIDEYNTMVGNSPEIIHSEEEVAQIRDARAQEMKAKSQGEAALKATEGAKNLATSPIGGDSNMLEKILQGQSALAAQQPAGAPSPMGGA